MYLLCNCTVAHIEIEHDFTLVTLDCTVAMIEKLLERNSGKIENSTPGGIMNSLHLDPLSLKLGPSEASAA